MTMRLALFGLALLLTLGGCNSGPEGPAAKSAPSMAQLRIAAEGKGKDCLADAPDWPAEQRAYVRHLADRLEIPVLVCPVASKAEAARALAERRADFALLDPASYAPFKDALRPILTQRIPIDLGRTEVVLAVAQASPLRSLADIDRAALLFAGSAPPRLAGPKRTLASAGVPEAALSSARIVGSPGEVSMALRSVPNSAGAFLSADWSRLCRGEAKDDQPCKGLREVWRGRPQAASAWAVRRDIPRETWARLVGIHVALFQDNARVAHWLAPKTTEIEPTESTALDPARAPK